jgi:transcriptional regulator with PAS, ATPase and Fis domain
MSPGRFLLIDCFSSGKGNSDEMFLKFFDDPVRNSVRAPVHIADPADPSRLEQALIDAGTRDGQSANYVFDSLTGMLDLWGDENRVVRLFGHLCPRLYDLSTLAYWLVETDAHSEAFLAKVRHITQVIIEVSLANGERALTVHKAAGRNAAIGIPQPLDLEEVASLQDGEEGRGIDHLTRRGEELRRSYRVDSIVGGSAAIRRLLGLAATAACSRSSVLITGETGTGKELIANVVHYNSDRAAKPLVKINCGALPESLQVKLLRVLQERQFEPVGSSRTMTVDVRIVAATSRDLRSEIKAGRFRHDLFYRLNVITIQLPPLRERSEDIPLLVDHFLEKYNREANRQVTQMPRDVLDVLLAYSWPGNVRELENCIERAVVMSSDNTVSLELIPEEIRENRPDYPDFPGPDSASDPQHELRQAVIRRLALCKNPSGIRNMLLETVEETILRQLMDSGQYSQRELAHLLGLSRVTLRKKLEYYKLS